MRHRIKGIIYLHNEFKDSDFLKTINKCINENGDMKDIFKPIIDSTRFKDIDSYTKWVLLPTQLTIHPSISTVNLISYDEVTCKSDTDKSIKPNSGEDEEYVEQRWRIEIDMVLERHTFETAIWLDTLKEYIVGISLTISEDDEPINIIGLSNVEPYIRTKLSEHEYCKKNC